ncbi:MAG: hypothetical protein ACYSTL_05760 [Planctomycetota bacterium]|jgi:hypothetical protein
MQTILKTLIAVCFLVTLPSCRNYATPAAARPQLTAAEREFEALWKATREVLRKYYFEIDSEDRRAGLITTAPMTGKYFGEFWRRDAATNRDLAEGTLQMLYRQAKVTIRSGGQAGRFGADVEVHVLRSHRQEVQVTNTSEALGLFRLPGGEDRKGSMLDYGEGEPADALEPLGRDANLERRIAADILERSILLRGAL